MPLARLERQQRARAGDHDVEAGLDSPVPHDDRKQCALAHQVVAHDVEAGLDARFPLDDRQLGAFRAPGGRPAPDRARGG